MGKHTRIVVFDGGLLEVTDYGDEDGSVYLELPTLPQRIPGAAETHPPSGPFEPANAALCRRVLRLLQDLP
ncbi:hypothetical protein [Nocardia pneumoniae]|uniref:hypothetical protein n=1 Tax=Nocardia pneumoniae TaxID=228601 RepID=UPI0003047170|nr:hypothetical protein [Nocardia pneumoniae]